MIAGITGDKNCAQVRYYFNIKTTYNFYDLTRKPLLSVTKVTESPVFYTSNEECNQARIGYSQQLH